MKSDFLNETSPDAYVDYPPVRAAAPQHAPDNVLCPKCKGHGGWNLKLNHLGLPPKMEDTMENRHKYCHFRSSCAQCSGWGWTTPDNVSCVHEFKRDRNVGNCLNVYKCTHCGKEETWDSSG